MLRRQMLIMATAMLVVAAAALAGFGLAQTGPGRAWLASALSRALSSDSAHVTVSGLEGTVPFDMRIRDIRVADANGDWLTVSDTAVEIGIRALLRGTLSVRRLSAAEVAVARMPAPAPDTAETAEGRASLSIPDLPLDAILHSVHIERIRLGGAVLGQPLLATLEGQGRIAGDAAQAQLKVERTDSEPGHVRLELGLQPSGILNMYLDAAEPTGLLLKHALRRDERLPVDVAIHGEGSVASWRGTLRAEAGDLAQIDATLAIEAEDGYRIRSEGKLSVGALLPPRLAPLLQSPATYSAAASISGSIIRIESLELATGELTLKASGRYDTAAGTFSAEATGNMSEISPVGAMIGMPLSGEGRLAIRAEGISTAPSADARVRLEGVKAAGIALGSATADIKIAPGDGIWHLAGTGALESLELQGGPLQLPDRIDWTLASRIDSKLGFIEVDRLRLNAGAVEVTASGRADSLEASPHVRARARLDIADLAGLQGYLPLPFHGSLSLDVDAETDLRAFKATFDGDARDLRSGEPALDVLLGNRVALSGAVRRADSGTIELTELKFAGAHASLEGDAVLTSDMARLDGSARLNVPQLAVLSDPLGMALAGAAAVRATFTGPPETPAVAAHVEATSVNLEGWQLDRMAAKLDLPDATVQSGRLDATFNAGTLEGRATAAFARPSPEVLSISNLSLTAPGTTLEGGFELAHGRLEGSLSVHAADLGKWSPLAGADLAGSVEGRLALGAGHGQNADLHATVKGFRSAQAAVSVERVKVDARVADLFGAPSGKATVEGVGIASPGLRADTLRVSAQSSKARRFGFTADSRGTLQPGSRQSGFLLSATGEIALDDRERRIRIMRLTGRLGDNDFASLSPATIVMGPGPQSFEGFDLRIGPGRVTASGRRDGEEIALKAELSDLPLKLMESFAPGQIKAGTAAGSLAVSGTVTRPQGRFDVRLRDLRPAGLKSDAPPLAAAASGTWRNGRLDMNGRIDGPKRTGLDLTAALPLALDAATLLPVVPENAPIRATARGEGTIDAWAPLLPLGEDRISGRYAIDVLIQGTIAAPEAGGRLTIENGRYVNFVAGTELRNLDLELVGDGRHFTLTRFAATDPANGKISGGGAVDLAAWPSPTVDIDANFTDFQIVRRDELTGTADGQLRLSGTIHSATLSGEVRVNRAEGRIPERLPANIPRLDVVKIDSQRGKLLSKEVEPDSDAVLKLDLQLDIPARAFVRGRGLDSEWRGALHVGGTADAPTLSGRLAVVRGDFSLLGKRFTLANSTIEFSGAEHIDPQLHIVAEHSSASIVAQAVITGTASNPTIQLTSQPELPQDEVLAHVLFGRGVGAITPVQGLELAQAAATLAGRGGSQGILERLRTATGLDRLDVSSDPAHGGGGAAGVTVTAGEYVTDKVFVGVEQGADAASTRTKVEVELTPNMTVQSDVGVNSSAGVGVNWKWDY